MKILSWVLNKTAETPLQLPPEYHLSMLSDNIDFFIHGFKKNYIPGGEKTLVIKKRDCEQWFNEFVDKCISACGRQFLPIYRMSDGEFLFMLGEQPLDIRWSFKQKMRIRLGLIKHKILLSGGLGPFTQGHYHSGEYSAKEWQMARINLPHQIRKISECGILALHLNYVKTPFAERYFPALGKWLQEHKIIINDDNYYPFYFVYAMLTGPRRGELLKNRRILVVNGAEGDKRQKIIDGLKREGVAEVLWCPISLKRSLYDSVDMTPFLGKVDLALVGAGIGKSNILVQMESLNVPCIDAGFVFEVWANPENKFKRVFCATDDDWDRIGSSPEWL